VCKKALKTGTSFLGGLAGKPGRGHFCLCELYEGNLEGGFPCLGPWKIGRKCSGDGHLFP